MNRIPLALRFTVVAPAILAIALVPRTVSAQLRSFAGITVLTVEPASGAEADAKAFARRLHDSEKPRLVADASEVLADDHGKFARCVVRNDLPERRRFGLACSDHAGAYVGMLRATSVKQLAERLWDQHMNRFPRARPLTSYRYIYFEPPTKPSDAGYREYVIGLFRNDKSYTVVDSPETLSAEDKGDLLRCRVNPVRTLSGPWWAASLNSSLGIRDASGDVVFSFVAGGTQVFGFGAAKATRRGLRQAFEDMLRARAEDEETYAAAPPPKESR